MNERRNKSFALGFYSLLTVLSSATVATQHRNAAPKIRTSHSLIVPEQGSRFTESLVIVATLDGKIRALDPGKNGAVRWSTLVSQEPLLSSSLSSLQMMDEFTGFRLIPSLDGGLYQFSWDSIEAIPLTAETLLSSSFKLNEGIGLVGGKNVQAMGVDPKTGKIIYSCSNSGCKESSSPESHDDMLVIKRTQKTVRAVSERTGAERWNFSVGQHSIDFLNGNKGSHERIPADSETSKNIRVSIPEGLIAGVKEQTRYFNDVLWKRRFDVPIAAVWCLENGNLEELDLLKITVPPESLHGDNLPLMYYIGSHQDQLYVHPSDEMENAVKMAIENMMLSSRSEKKHALVQSRKSITWKPYLATSASRTPAIVGQTELAIRKPLDYPFDNGYYFYGQMPDSLFDEKGDCFNNITHSGDENNIEQGFLHKLRKTIFKWWRELLILLFTVGFFARQMFKYWYKCKISNKPCPDVNLTVGNYEIQVRNVSNDSKMIQSGSTATIVPPENFVSRYEYDFEHETCLGRGGFGLVFQARNKLDDCQYAVKRIRLPNSQEARNKVMREVKVLATLDHCGIVRYYNSWCEEQPREWLRDWDEKLKADSSCQSLMSTPSLTETSEEDKVVFQISEKEDSLSSDRIMFQNSSIQNSRKRLDTLTDENEGHDSSLGFSIQFKQASFGDNVSGNNNSGKVNDDSSSVVFQHGSNTGENSVSHLSRSESGTRDSGFPSVTDKPPLHFLYIQMQLCRRDSLKDWLSSNVENRDYSFSITIFKQLLDAVEYIHQKLHIHRDLKPSNILFAHDGAVKVGDFGLVSAYQPCTDDADHIEPRESSNQNLTGQVGTQLYMSPEQVKGRTYCSKVDIYSLGIIFFELYHVFYTQMERHNVLSSVRQRKVPDKFCKEMPLQTKFVLWLLAENPSDRPSAQDILVSSIFKELSVPEISTTPKS